MERGKSRSEMKDEPVLSAQDGKRAPHMAMSILLSGVFAKSAASALFLAAAIIAGATTLARAAECTASPKAAIDWSGCDRSNLVLSGANLEGASLQKADFTQTDLRNARLASSNLEKAALVRASLAGAVADKANFTKVEGYRTNLSGLSARGASFHGAELQRADFRNSDLTGSSFEKAELGRAIFAGANLTGTVYPLAILARADFSGAILSGPVDFTGAYMFLTRLEGVDLSAAIGLEQGQIDIACGDAATRLPAGLTPPALWPCAVE